MVSDPRTTSPTDIEAIGDNKMPSSPASSASSIFDGSNFSDLSIDDDFEFINEFSEDDDRHSLNGLDDDETPNASYVNQQERNRVRTLSADSDEGKIKESSSRLSFSFPDPQSDEHWIETASDDETPELVDTPTFPQTDSQAVNEAEMSQEALDKMCSTVDWVLGTQPSVKEASVMVPEKSVVIAPVKPLVARHNSFLALLSTYTSTFNGKGAWSAATLGLAILAAAGASLISGQNTSALLVWPFAHRPSPTPTQPTITVAQASWTPAPTLLGLPSPVSFLTIAATPHVVNAKLKMKALATVTPCQKCDLSSMATLHSSPLMRTDASTSRSVNKQIFHSSSHSDNRSIMMAPQVNLWEDLTAALLALREWQDLALQQASFGYDWFLQHYQMALPDLLALQERVRAIWMEMQRIASQSGRPAEQQAKALVLHSVDVAKKHWPAITVQDRERIGRNAKALVVRASGHVVRPVDIAIKKADKVVHVQAIKGHHGYKRLRKSGKEKVRKASRVAKKLKKQRKILEKVKGSFSHR